MKRACSCLVAAALVVLSSPALAHACAVCFSAKNEASRIAFLATTVFMTALPLVMIGLVLLWLLKRNEAAARAEAELEPVLAVVPEDDDAPATRRNIVDASTRL